MTDSKPTDAQYTEQSAAQSAMRPPTQAGTQSDPQRNTTFLWLIAIIFGTAMSFTTVPTTLWSLYESAEHYSTMMVTVAFTSYSFGVLLSLVLLGHLSDWRGRRPLIAISLLCQIAAAVALMATHLFMPVVIARFVSGVGVGMLTATATAYLAELAIAGGRFSPSIALVIATAANLGGLGAGPLVGGAPAQWAPCPLVVPYGIYLALLIVCLGVLRLGPETATIRSRRYHPQRIRVQRADRAGYLVAIGVGAATFCVQGLSTSLFPQLLGQLSIHSRFWQGLLVACVLFASAATQIMMRSLSASRLILTGLPAIGLGVVLMLCGVILVNGVLFALGGIIGGAGGGAAFRGALAQAQQLASADAQGEAAAGVFVGAYLGMSVPVLGIGFASLAGAPLRISVAVFALFVLAFAIVLAIGTVKTGRRSFPEAKRQGRR
ncbi:MFS transporter [Bifidobacterium subtile]|uniref:Major facilitator superfamily MFS_1 n=1 Tax=Bifidobacterium subtile TaxID=77635 RepID=A0A087E6Y7_9BIFI|nr:MFS transporter [Bifidobacterium subtile]KFJ03538.1 major facilitator superfamily MFS_1 [Bifidobacterium subtile]QOL36361.1 MFS transporter [Bifidobacterium subtile]